MSNPTDSESLRDFMNGIEWLEYTKRKKLEGLIEAEITKRETALLDELTSFINKNAKNTDEVDDYLWEFIASKRPTNNKDGDAAA